MSSILQPWHILLATICGLVYQRQQQIIEFQNAHIEALLKQLGQKRLLLNDDQRRLLAVKDAIGRKHRDRWHPSATEDAQHECLHGAMVSQPEI